MSTELNLDAERVAFEAWLRNRWPNAVRPIDEKTSAGHYVFTENNLLWEAWQAACRTVDTSVDTTAPVSAPLDTQALPPLPKCKMLVGAHLDSLHVLYTAEQMFEYASKHVAPYAERIRHLERELAERKPASIDTPEFRNLLWKFERQSWSVTAINNLIAYIDGNTTGTAPELYTCIGKGGEYEHIGVAAGAGVTRGNLVHVYRDKTSGNLFYRTPMDFDTRMAPLAAVPSSMSKGKEEANADQA